MQSRDSDKRQSHADARFQQNKNMAHMRTTTTSHCNMQSTTSLSREGSSSSSSMISATAAAVGETVKH